MLSAIAENNVETATLLLRAGADYLAKTKAGNRVLHLVANVGEVPMLATLAKARMRGLDLDAHNSDGHTAAEKAEMRDEAPEGFLNAFERLQHSVVDEEFDAGSWAMNPSSAEGSWHSFDEMSWFEAEAVVLEDVDRAEKEAEACVEVREVEDDGMGGELTLRLGKVAV